MHIHKLSMAQCASKQLGEVGKLSKLCLSPGSRITLIILNNRYYMLCADVAGRKSVAELN